MNLRRSSCGYTPPPLNKKRPNNEVIVLDDTDKDNDNDNDNDEDKDKQSNDVYISKKL